MNERERLIELIDGWTGDIPAKALADYLLANGVVVQRWIPVTERLPKKGQVVLACGKIHATSGQFQGTGRNPSKWNWKGNTIKEVSHWMPLPEPPKEEE